MKQHPNQPLQLINGVLRFKPNSIVRYLLDAGPYNMNHIACLPNVPVEDREQFVQLIGYSLSGFEELSYVRNKTYKAVETENAELLAKIKAKRKLK